MEEYSGILVSRLSADLPRWQYNVLRAIYKENPDVSYSEAEREVGNLTIENFEKAKEQF